MPTPEAAFDLMSFLDRSPTPWHAVAEGAARLERSGFRELYESDARWRCAPGEGVFVRRGGALVAWIVPRSRPGSLVVGLAHTDSPCLRLKPRPGHALAGCRKLSVEAYGGLLHHSWLDRELRVAGRVVVRDGGRGRECLLDLDDFRPLIPSLAIHLDRGVNERGLVLDRERHLPVLAGLDGAGAEEFEELVGRTLGVPAGDVLGWDLCLVDGAAAAVAGLGDLVVSGRLDNLASCHALLAALSSMEPTETVLPLVALLDGEEVGSGTAEGADSRFLPRLLERMLGSLGLDSEDTQRLLATGFALSCDMAHAVHPNHPEKHDPRHAPLLGRGPVLKWNAGLRYATTAAGTARLRLAAGRAGVPLQVFSMRADLACGSTVGPLVSAGLGMEAVDCGAPMLAMHACRETMAAKDHADSILLYREILRSD
ncbi:MAG: M18 family aminopeptidase [Fibrobacteria bacterium]|nr:M18 family aminopeptidase [Fibrobacteria bacterium]